MTGSQSLTPFFDDSPYRWARHAARFGWPPGFGHEAGKPVVCPSTFPPQSTLLPWRAFIALPTPAVRWPGLMALFMHSICCACYFLQPNLSEAGKPRASWRAGGLSAYTGMESALSHAEYCCLIINYKDGSRFKISLVPTLSLLFEPGIRSSFPSHRINPEPA